MDVSTLVSQMHDTLSKIHSTLASLDTTSHDTRLDELERQRDSALSTLHNTFEQEADTLAQKRKIELDEIAEQRRREDEERERRRRLEDEQLAERNLKEDQERHLQLEKDTQDLDEETDGLMMKVEEDATRLLEEGKEKLRELEERRRASVMSLVRQQIADPEVFLNRRSTGSLTSSSRRRCQVHRRGGKLRAPLVLRCCLPWLLKVRYRHRKWLTSKPVTLVLRLLARMTILRGASRIGYLRPRNLWDFPSLSQQLKPIILEVQGLIALLKISASMEHLRQRTRQRQAVKRCIRVML